MKPSKLPSYHLYHFFAEKKNKRVGKKFICIDLFTIKSDNLSVPKQFVRIIFWATLHWALRPSHKWMRHSPLDYKTKGRTR